MTEPARTCPRCRRAPLRLRTHQKTGDPYYLCDNYPDCDFVGWPEEGQDSGWEPEPAHS
ncbi:MAG: topoisomerase DNA-binding C4 zinc finger domain-containing protein [Firmicutes bacterium]|nr:topoisomerase DNA-binding C4 zinc finger domain-containing protein [Alicyclobacillaceae bacterium]MCL6497111.1 topoisomerase DNA-binding C4 zinc finger domain-containing protein [Bacillota bacterium]